jgi:hypothetical protein
MIVHEFLLWIYRQMLDRKLLMSIQTGEGRGENATYPPARFDCVALSAALPKWEEGYPLYPSDISPKYDNEKLGCKLSSRIVGFAQRVLREGRLGEGLCYTLSRENRRNP